MKFRLLDYNNELIPVNEIADLIVESSEYARNAFSNFLKLAIEDGELLLRGEVGFPVDFRKFIQKRERERSRENQDLVPQRRGLSGKPSPPLSLEDRIQLEVARELPRFMEITYLTKADISNWLRTKGFECEFLEGKFEQLPPRADAVSDPSQGEQKSRTKHLQQGGAIIEAIHCLGCNPKELHPIQAGKRWVKSDVWTYLGSRTDLFVSKRAFDKAWDRLRGNSEIVERKATPPK